MDTIHPLLKKLNFKNKSSILVLNHPFEFDEQIGSFQKETKVKVDLKKINEIEIVLAFVKQIDEINTLTPLLNDKLVEDGILWFAYPKKSSKKYESEINRSTGWEVLGQYNFEPVRQIAIDENWSALRFRDVDFIKTIKRNPKMILSKKGKERTKE